MMVPFNAIFFFFMTVQFQCKRSLFMIDPFHCTFTLIDDGSITMQLFSFMTIPFQRNYSFL